VRVGIELGRLSVIERELALEGSFLLGKELLESGEGLVVRVGQVGESLPELLEDVPHVLVEGGSPVGFSVEEVLEVVGDISWGESVWWGIWVLSEGLLLGLNAGEEGNEVGLFSDPLSPLVLLVLSEAIDERLSRVVVGS